MLRLLTSVGSLIPSKSYYSGKNNDTMIMIYLGICCMVVIIFIVWFIFTNLRRR
jgi:hypothetical protein